MLTSLTFLVLSGGAVASSNGYGYSGYSGYGGYGGYQPPKKEYNVQVGPRPYYLVDNLKPGPFKDKLEGCSENKLRVSKFAIGHRGAALQFPEHSRQSYHAAARLGAGVIECDVTFTSDKKLVCRHSQCDLHFTTNILETPLAKKCTVPPNFSNPSELAKTQCCTSDITLAEFETLCAKMEGIAGPTAVNGTQFGGRLYPAPKYRTELYGTCGTIMTHEKYIKLIDSFGRDFTPEAKTPVVKMPFKGWTQAEFASAIIEDYIKHGISPSRVWPQSFLPDDIFLWIKKYPKFGKQAIYLDERTDTAEGYQQAIDSFPALKKKGVKILAPPIYALVNASSSGEIVPSPYAKAARKLGFDIITWSFERDPPISQGIDYYYQSVTKVAKKDSDELRILDVIARQIGAIKVFADWSGTTTYYANCFNYGGFY